MGAANKLAPRPTLKKKTWANSALSDASSVSRPPTSVSKVCCSPASSPRCVGITTLGAAILKSWSGACATPLRKIILDVARRFSSKDRGALGNLSLCCDGDMHTQDYHRKLHSSNRPKKFNSLDVRVGSSCMAIRGGGHAFVLQQAYVLVPVFQFCLVGRALPSAQPRGRREARPSAASCCGWPPRQRGHACHQPCASPGYRRAVGCGSWHVKGLAPLPYQERWVRLWWPDSGGDKLEGCQSWRVHPASCDEGCGGGLWASAFGIAVKSSVEGRTDCSVEIARCGGVSKREVGRPTSQPQQCWQVMRRPFVTASAAKANLRCFAQRKSPTRRRPAGPPEKCNHQKATSRYSIGWLW